MNTKLILLLSFCLLATPKLIFAHGGDHEEEKTTASLTKKTSSFNDSIYSVGGEEEAELSSIVEPSLDSPFLNFNAFEDDDSSAVDIKINAPMKHLKDKINSEDQHDQHKKQHVEESLHEWVSPNAKGYKAAIGITIISGLGFMVLSFFRVGETR